MCSNPLLYTGILRTQGIGQVSIATPKLNKCAQLGARMQLQRTRSDARLDSLVRAHAQLHACKSCHGTFAKGALYT